MNKSYFGYYDPVANQITRIFPADNMEVVKRSAKHILLHSNYQELELLADMTIISLGQIDEQKLTWKNKKIEPVLVFSELIKELKLDVKLEAYHQSLFLKQKDKEVAQSNGEQREN